MGRRWSSLLALALIVGYLLLTQYAILRHSSIATAAGLMVLITVLLAPGLWRVQRTSWLSWIFLIGLVLSASVYGLIGYAPYLIPVLIDGYIAWLFGHTLLPGNEPLIARLIRILDGPELIADDNVVRYARRLTLAWALLMLTLGLIAVLLGLLALFADQSNLAMPPSLAQQLWNGYANGIHYLVVAVFFLGEFFYRRYALPQAPRLGLLEFVHRVKAVWPLLLREMTNPTQRI